MLHAILFLSTLLLSPDGRLAPDWAVVNVPEDTLTYVPLAPHEGRECGPDGPVDRICRARTPWSEADLRARWVREGAPVWADGDTLTFVFEGDHEGVSACCTVQMPLSRFGADGLWALSVRVPRLQDAVTSYGFLPSGAMRLVEQGTWRGPGAAPPPPRMVALQGRLVQDSLRSEALGERRAVTVYLPPGHDGATTDHVVYVADGQGVEGLAAYVEPFILAGEVPPVVLVGLHSGPGRGEEYTGLAMPGASDSAAVALFEAHERFVVEEAMPWAEARFAPGATRARRATFGFSNGAVWAAALALRRPDLVGVAIPFSCGACGQRFPDVLPSPPAQERPRFYFLAGVLETSFHRTTMRTARELREAGFEVHAAERVSGHDPLLWNEQIGDALRWAFGGS